MTAGEPILEWVETGKTRLLRDQEGVEVNLVAVEEACQHRGLQLVFARPSDREREAREAMEGHAREWGAPFPYSVGSDPAEKVSLALRDPVTAFVFDFREARLDESVKALRAMLAEHDLLGAH